MTERITPRQFHSAEGVDDWRVLYHPVSAYFRTVSLAKGVALVDEIGRLADYLLDRQAEGRALISSE